MAEVPTYTQYTKPIADAFSSIGYKHHLIKRDYNFVDFGSEKNQVRKIHLGIFGQEPFDYRSACFGAHYNSKSVEPQIIANELRSFGALQFFILSSDETEVWMNAKRSTVLKTKIKTEYLPNYIRQNGKYWKPDEVIRLKSGFKTPGPQQIDFVDVGLLQALEGEASRKIDVLIRSILSKTEEEIKKTKLKFRSIDVFSVVFRLLTAKLFKDRGNEKYAIDFSQPHETLKVISKHYGGNFTNSLPDHIINEIAREISDSFSLQNLSVDTLTYIYENTFVSQESRKKLGIHSTPSYIADYIFKNIPMGDISRTNWNVLDPMCGHGIFLIAAMRRMRDLLPSDWGGAKRHKFFINHLRGVEIDPFSVEVARMCLTLSDFPESNGWKIKQADVFSHNILKQSLSKTTILVGNPPFEIIEGKRPNTPKPKELLKRSLEELPADSFIGIVLPRSFLDGNGYKSEREFLLKNFDLINITELPERVFAYASTATSIVIAKKQVSDTKTKYVVVTESDKLNFQNKQSSSISFNISKTLLTKDSFVIPRQKELWDVFIGFPTLGTIANILKGVEYKLGLVKEHPDLIIKNIPFPGSHPGLSKIDNVKEGFFQYTLNKHEYISIEKKFWRSKDSAIWLADWKRPKVIVPASRLSNKNWRFDAVIDKQGLMVTRRFYAIWPKNENISVEVLAALLNSPIAQAFTFDYSNQQDTRKRTYANIPIPFHISSANSIITTLVNEYTDTLNRDKERSKELLLQIDAEILRLYNLPPRLERKLLDLFWGEERRVPFKFTGYIPPEKESWIPLHIYISDEYKNATPQQLLKAVSGIKDPELIETLKNAGVE